MGLKDGEIAIIKVQQLDLNTYTNTRQEIINYSKNLIDGITEATRSKDDVKDETEATLAAMSPDTRYKIEIIAGGLVEPALNKSDIIFLSKMFPLVTMRIYNKIMELTNGGASAKKN